MTKRHATAGTQSPVEQVTGSGKPPNGTPVGEVPQWRLMTRRFQKSKLAVAGGVILLFMYLVAALAPFLSPNRYDALDSKAINAAPSQLTWDGGLAVCGRSQVLDESTFTWKYRSDCRDAVPIRWFGEGFEYELFGLFPTNRHLMTVEGSAKLYLWGADTQGRDVFSRALQGSRVSLTIGLVGVLVSTALAAVLGTASGFFGGAVDNILQRVIELIQSIPTLPLWATLAAALPREMSVVQRYFFISLILSLVAWTGLARQVRGKVMSYASSDYVYAARAAGSSNARIILTHLIPNSASHIVVVAMLAVPGTIIAETSLSFLGIGMLPPAVSWGVLLQDAQKVEVVTAYPWLLIPAGLVVLAVTCFQLLGDGIRDAVDPYA